MSASIDFMNMSRQEILALAKPTKEYQEMLEIWPPLKIDWDNHAKAVAYLRTQTEYADEMDEQDRQVAEEIINISARDNYQLKLRVFRSQRSSTTPNPLVVLWHGGGWVLGSPTMVANIARSLVKKFGVVVVAPNYRLAPESPWPTPFNDGWDGFNWIRANAEKLGTDPRKGFIIGGVSAGASMAIVFAHLARDENLEPKITGVYSACGSARARDETQLEERYQQKVLSRTQEECIDNPVLSKDFQKFIGACVKPDTNSKIFAPLVWPEEEGHRNLPRVYQQVCGRDPNRDECLVFSEILKDSGVGSRIDLYAGLPHCFWIAFQHVPEYKKWQVDTMEGFEWLLKGANR